ncbi:hypothetical protein [Leisingera caerulea]|uniref:hypothetical protein n=1 Tax=Leisingera caerulea TaxID=506591 RepID=UPI0021A34DC6|nr:hypothetical protein [Leisingera caerulea]UWQ86102.1 hypothetical protein K3726_21575 [Leisingera caerulea]
MNTQITSAAFAASGEDASAAEFYLADCAEAEGFAEALQAAGGRFERLAGAPADWQAAEQRPVLVIYERAETAVCKGLAGGQSPAQVLEHWQARAQALLAFCRRNRRRLALVEAGSLRRDAGPVLEQACKQLGISPLPGLDLDPPQDAAGPVWQVIADQAVAQSAAAVGLGGELEAQAVLQAPLPAQVQAAAQAYAGQTRELEMLPGLQAELQAERAGRAALEAQLQAEADNRARTARLKDSQVELQLAQVRSLQDALEAELSRLAGLEQAAAEAAALRGRVAALEAERAERETWLQDKDAQLQALWSSTSWRITGPLRRIKLALTGAGRAK